MPDWRLRRAVLSDAARLTDVIHRAYAPAHARGIVLPDVAGGIAEDIRDHLVWVAVAGAQYGGVIVIVAEKDAAHLANIAVDPSAGGQGVGKVLIEGAIAYLRQHGVTRLDLTTHVDMPENILLYLHLGWRESGREANKVYMTRALG